jgi:hypothetical protein
MEQIVGLLVDLGQNLVSILLLITILETVASSWAIFDTHANETFALAWEKLIVLDQT